MIELNNVSFGYTDEDVIKNVSLVFGSGVTAVVGPNGSGKTTLLKLAAAIYRPRAGEVFIDGINIWSAPENVRILARRDVVYVHEKPIMLRGSVADNIAYGLRVRNISNDEVAARVEEVMGMLGIRHLAQEKAHTLSAGQQQKVAIARALAVRPKNLLLDEPTANLDKNSWEAFVELIKELAKKEICIVIATHDRLLALQVMDRLIIVENKTAVLVESPERIG